MPREIPGVGVSSPVAAAWRTSLGPISIVTKVGSASSALPTWVFPPRNSVVSVLWNGDVSASTSVEAADGTATLLSTTPALAVWRSVHVLAVAAGAPAGTPVCTTAPVCQLAIGGVQPG